MKRTLLFLYILFYLVLCIQSQNQIINTSYNNYINNQFLQNRFFIDPNGKCYYSNPNDSVYCFNYKHVNKWDLKFEKIKLLSFDAHKPQVIYCINTDNEVMKSVTNGESWIKIQNGLPTTENFIDIKVNPHNSSEIFLLSRNNIYRTTDAGFTWNHIYRTKFTHGFSISQNLPNKLFLSDSDSLYLSDNGGLNWNNISRNIMLTNQFKSLKSTIKGQFTLYSFANFLKNDTILLYLFSSHGIYYTSDEGATWKEANKNMDSNSNLFNFYFDDSTIYAGGSNTNDEPVLYKSNISPVSWTKIEVLADKEDYITGIYKESENASIFLSTFKNKLYQIDSIGQTVGLNYGLLPHSIVHSKVNYSSNNSNIIIALIENNNPLDIKRYGIWKSIDNGMTWKDIYLYNKPNSAYGLTRLMVNPHNSNEILLFDKGNDLITFDGGILWGGIQNNKIKLGDKTIVDFQYDSFDKNILYIITYDGKTELIRYDKTTFGFTVLRTIEDDIADSKEMNFLISSDDNKKIFICNGDISSDGGWTWESVFENMDKITDEININTAEARVISYSKNRIEVELKDRGYNGIWLCNMIISEDNGKTWSLKKKWEEKK